MNFTVIAVAAWALVTLIGADASNPETTATNIGKRSPSNLGFELLGELLGLISGHENGLRSKKISSIEQNSVLTSKSGQAYHTYGLENNFGSEYYGGFDYAPVPTAGPVVPVSHEVHVINRHVQPVSAPYPVPVNRDVAVPVPHPVPYPVDSPFPVFVPAPYTVPVERPVPYAVDKPVHHAVPAPYPVPVVRNVPVPVPKPYAFPVVKQVPVPVAAPYAVQTAAPEDSYEHRTFVVGDGHEKSAHGAENHSSKSLTRGSDSWSSYGRENNHYYEK